MEKQTTIYYHMVCGCVLEKKGLKKNYNILSCRKHGGLVKQRTRCCATCGKEYVIARTKKATIRCKECIKKQKAVNAMKHYNKVLKEAGRVRRPDGKLVKVEPVKKPIWHIPQKIRAFSKDRIGDYCRKLPMCMLYHKKLPCADCKNFVPIIKGHDPRKLEQFTY